MTTAPAPPSDPFLGLAEDDDPPHVRWYRRLRPPGRRTSAAIVLSLVGLAGLTAVQVVLVAPSVGSELEQRSQEALADAGITSLQVRVDGRDVVLTGPAKDDRQAFAAEHVVAEVDGVRYVDATGVVVDAAAALAAARAAASAAPAGTPSPAGPGPSPTPSPTARGANSARTTLVVVATGGRVVVAGAFPDDATAQKVVTSLGRTYDPGDVELLAPTSDTVTGTGSDAVAKTVAALGADAVGVTVSLDRGTITVAARVADAATKAKALAAAARAVPDPAGVVDRVTVGDVTAPDAATLDAQLSSLPALVFGAGQTAPGPIGRSVLAAAAAVLVASPEATVTLVGHTDDSGDPTADTAVSLARARAAEQYLATLGVRTSRVATTGAGSADPAQPGTSPDARAADRRLVVVGGS
ncbi:OmpA family protein [Kineosporia sp. A_224]|uniref:OmpA family protein n=1 Tax=Kineosporia sp. A_224 TaxID=1962180 RepID=UPI0013040380|nr:OmpA family protein [Kineosporia sp. A_224]